MAIPELKDSKDRLTDCIYFGDPISSSVGSGFVPNARIISTTAPLAGGGDLSADRTLSVGTFDAANDGVVPASGGGTTNFLRADGSWVTIPVASGGTGQTTAQAALNALAGGVTSGQYLRGNGANVLLSAIQAADVPTLNQNTTGTASNVTGTVAVANGGTGATDAATARTNLGLGSIATQAASSVSITGGAISGVTLSASSVTDTGLTSGYLPKAGVGGLLGDSPVYTDGTNVGIGRTPSAKLTVGAGSTLNAEVISQQWEDDSDGFRLVNYWHAGGIDWRFNKGATNLMAFRADNVGIGTTSPGAKLTIHQGTSNALGAGFRQHYDDTHYWEWIADTTAGLWLGYNNANKFYLTTGGAVVIGGTSPASGRLLDVNGIIKATGIQLTTGASNGYVLKSDASGNASWQVGGGGMTYKGTWDANTNTPTLADGTGTAGDTYAVTVGGTQFGRTFTAGGWAIYSGTIWEPVGTSVSVTSVNGLTGAVSLSLASSAFVNQGTTTTVLHGNAAGNPSWDAVSLTADVSGTLPVGNGGTGATTLSGVVHGNGASAMTAGAVALASEVSGTLPVANGGTGLTSLAAGRIPFGAGAGGTDPLGNTDFLKWDSSLQNLHITSRTGIGASGDCAVQITSQIDGGGNGEPARIFLQGQGTGGYAAFKMGCASLSGEFLVAVGKNHAGLEFIDTNHAATRLSIDNATGVIEVPAGVTVGGTAVSLVGHTHTGLLSGLTAGRVPYATSATALSDDAGMTYDAGTDRLTTGILDTGGQVVNVLAYGLDNTGATDVTAALQAILNAAYDGEPSHAKVVYLPRGRYKVLTHFTIPYWVTLMGDPHGGNNVLQGTVLELYESTGGVTGTPAISLQDSATLMNVGLWYPNQTASPPTPYPFAIYLGGYCTVDSVHLGNAYQGIDSATGTGFNVLHSANRIRNISGMPLSVGIDIDQAYDVTRVENIHFYPYYATWASWVEANGTGMKIGRSDWQHLRDYFQYGYNTGIKFYYSQRNANSSLWGGACGHLYNLGFDKTNVGIDLDCSQFAGVFVDGMAYASSSAAGSQYAVWGRFTSGTVGTTGYLHVRGLNVHGTVNTAVDWGAAGVVSIRDSYFMQWGLGGNTGYAVNIANGRAFVQHNYFADNFTGNPNYPNSPNGIYCQASVDRAVVTDNMMVGKALTFACATYVNDGNTV